MNHIAEAIEALSVGYVALIELVDETGILLEHVKPPGLLIEVPGR